MCRFVAYQGHPIIIDDILIKPKNSLIHQSIHAQETEYPLNGDGMGLGWYVHDIDNTPALFRSVMPAWNEPNFMALAPKIRTTSMFAHIRAANVGSVSLYNCHPFAYKDCLFMHNGDIGGFSHIKRDLRRRLSDEAYNWIMGQTDSEHMFALFINNVKASGLETTALNMAQVFMQTLKEIQQIKQDKNIFEPDYVNVVMSTGHEMLAFRYVSDPSLKSSSLYYSAGEEYLYRNGACHMLPSENDDSNQAVLVVSEKLTSYVVEWHEIKPQHYLWVDKDLHTKLLPIEI
jgi:predicted glutamine amidotransferase